MFHFLGAKTLPDILFIMFEIMNLPKGKHSVLSVDGEIIIISTKTKQRELALF